MTWTYAGNPAASNTAAVRFEIGDTDSNDQLITDEEIAYLLTQNGTVSLAAVAACEAIAAKFSRMVDKAVGDLRLSASQKSEQYLKLAQTLKRKGALKNAMPYSGGISIADKQANENDTDRVPPPFTTTQFDVPGIYNGKSDTGDQWQ